MSFAVTSTVGYLTQEAIKHLQSNGCKVKLRDTGHLSEDELLEEIRGIDGIIAGGDPYTDRIFQAADKLKIVARTGAGYDTVDIGAAAKHGIWVTNTPGANADAVADLTVGLMLSLLRNIPGMAADMKAGKWEQFLGHELGSMTVGIVGTGFIGRNVIKRVAGGFGSKVLAYDVQQDAEFASKYNVQYVPLDDLIAQSDIVSLHVAFNAETWMLLDEKRLKSLKKGAYLVNTSRPGIVDKRALIKALQARDIAGAAIDVHEPVPAAPDDPLVLLDNVIATPWVAYKSEESIARMCIMAAQDVVTVLQGGKPRFPVNKL